MSTIRDVARRAGVAPSTVSYALSGKRTISAEARARIAKAIDELNFSPSALGRRLAHSRSNTIGLVFPVSDSELAWETLDFLPSAAAALNKQGFGLSIFAGPMFPEQILKLYRENHVDGLILMQICHHDARVEILRNTGYPLVLIGRCANTRGLGLVDFDPEQAILTIFEHLVQLGHHHIGYLDLPQQKHKEKLGYARFVQLGLARAQKAFSIAPLKEEVDGTIDSSFCATLNLLQREPGISSFVTVSGSSHVGVLRALHQLGRRVPDDCSVIGISRRSWAQWSQPQLTSTDIPLIEMVRTGAEMLLRHIGGETKPQQVIFPAQLFVRESTAPIPS
jgi:DNA-binding LacI/PurR family transcriptional regulator